MTATFINAVFEPIAHALTIPVEWHAIIQPAGLPVRVKLGN